METAPKCICTRRGLSTYNGEVCQPCKTDYRNGWCPRRAMVIVRNPHTGGHSTYCLPCAEDAIAQGHRTLVED